MTVPKKRQPVFLEREWMLGNNKKSKEYTLGYFNMYMEDDDHKYGKSTGQKHNTAYEEGEREARTGCVYCRRHPDV